MSKAAAWHRFAMAPILIALCVYRADPVWAHSSGGPPPDSLARSLPRLLPESGSFVSFETPHVHPIDIGPDGTKLAVCNTPAAGPQAAIDLFVALAQSGHVDLTAHGVKDGIRRGWVLHSGTTFRSDNSAESISLAGRMALAGSGTITKPVILRRVVNPATGGFIGGNFWLGVP